MTGRGREFPPRPLIPVAAAAVVGVLVSVLAILPLCAEICLSGSGTYSKSTIIIVGSAVGCLVLAWLFRARQTLFRYLLTFGIGLVLGCISSMFWVIGATASYRALGHVPASRLTFRVAGDPSISDDGYSFHADALKDGDAIGSVLLVAPRDLPQGATVRVVGRVSAFDDDEWGRMRFFRREMRRVKVVKVLGVNEDTVSPLQAFRTRVISTIDSVDPVAGPLVAGIVCGRSSELKAGPGAEWFSRTGTSHLIAVSGSHLALVCFLAEDFAMRLRVNRRVRVLAMLSVGLAYTVFTGASASAVRSCCMVGAGLFVGLFGRRRHGVSALSCTMCILLVLNPSMAFDLGFRLFCASVLGILFFASYLGYVFSLFGLPDFIASPLALTLVAQLATAPLTLPVFGSLSPVAPLANLCIGPVLSALLMLGVISAPLIGLFSPLIALCEVPLAAARCVLFLEQLFSSLPMASISVSESGPLLCAPWLLLALLYVLWPRPRRFGVAVVLVLSVLAVLIPYVYWDRFAPPSVTILDVGQADAILVRQGASTLLVDAGVDGRVVEALSRQNVHHLDGVVITHWDEDHWGGLPDILQSMNVERLIVAKGASASEPEALAMDDIEIEEVERGNLLTIGGFTARVVWPRSSVRGLENEDSLCLKVDFNDGSRSLTMLLTGDSEVDQEHAYADEVGDIDVLKVGHHGSKVSIDSNLLQVLKPELCVASAGEGNRYGHPSKECREAVAKSGAAFICTIDAGDVCVAPGEAGPRVSLQRGSFADTVCALP